MKKYKYFLWDIDGTVLNFKAAEKTAIRSLFGKFNLGECTDSMLGRYSKINKKYWKNGIGRSFKYCLLKFFLCSNLGSGSLWWKSWKDELINSI